MYQTNLYTGARRVRRAYRTAAVVMLSYAWLLLCRRIFGEKFYQKRILALHLRNAERTKKAILELNGLFIKVGQMLSILSNFLPEAFQKPLEALQDKIPPRPYDQVRERIRRELGKYPEELFARFDAEPLAAASIGQAHRAQLPDGTEVVVKVQHADIEAIAQIDLEVVRKLTRVIAWFYNIKGTDFMYTQVRRMIEEELDFKKEAASMNRIRENIREEKGIVIPEVHAAYSGDRVLTTTWHEGVKIAQLEQIDAWKIDRQALAATILRAYCRMVFIDGLYHADPHPGNILVQSDGTIVLLDFGATGQLGEAMREGIPKLIETAVKNDVPGMIDACRSMGFIAEGREAEQMAEKMIIALRNFLQNEVKLEGLNFKDIQVNPFNNSLFSLIQEMGLNSITGAVQVPKDYVLLNRAITLLLGLCNTLDPTFNPLDVVRPYAKEMVLGQKGDLLSMVRNLLQGTLTNTLALPEELRQTLQKVRRGQLEMQTPDVRDSALLVYMAARQVLLFVALLSCIVAAQWFESAGNESAVRYAYVAAGLSGLLLLKAWREGGKLFSRMKR